MVRQDRKKKEIMTKEEEEEKVTVKNCSIKREKEKEKKIPDKKEKVPHTANVLFSQKIVQKKEERILKYTQKNFSYQYNCLLV